MSSRPTTPAAIQDSRVHADVVHAKLGGSASGPPAPTHEGEHMRKKLAALGLSLLTGAGLAATPVAPAHAADTIQICNTVLSYGGNIKIYNNNGTAWLAPGQCGVYGNTNDSLRVVLDHLWRWRCSPGSWSEWIPARTSNPGGCGTYFYHES